MQKNRVYNIPQAAKILGVHEMTIRYWIKKKWISIQYDYRNYPVFTDADIKKIEAWRNTLRKP
jgi:DNA-binding transcriptional MerR regulator